MPTYLFRNKNTQREWEEFLTISERNQFLEENTHIEQLVNGAPAIGDAGRLGRLKPDSMFRQRMKDIKKHNRHSTIDTGNLLEV